MRMSLKVKLIKVRIPADIAKIPIFLAKESSLSSNGVVFSSFELSTILWILPFVLFSPTPITKAFPFPSTQSVPDKIIGDTFFLSSFLIHISKGSFDTGRLSPVKLFSSIFIPFDSMTNKSAGIESPIDINIMSPTSKSSDFIFCLTLLRIVLK